MKQMSLLEEASPAATQPLASRMRPTDLTEFVGQEHLVGEGKLLRQIIERDQIPSMILWGPPGVGKTTLANVVANATKAEFVNYSAVTSGIKEIKEIMARAEQGRLLGIRTVLFVDEIHRFNKAQQDAFLPYVEKGSITLIGATTENPSFEINSALLSRCKVFVLNALSSEDLFILLKRALTDPRGFGGQTIVIDDDMLQTIAAFANGDARTALNTLEMCILNGTREADRTVVERSLLEQVTSKKSLLYDKDGEEHYNLISALHKSMRNSDPDAAVYWLARMLEAGEDPLYVARRLIRFASEDIGIADTRALTLCVDVYNACHYIGMPECNDALAEAVIYLSLSPRSNAVDAAYAAAREDAVNMLDEPVPLHLRNAPTRLMKELDYGKGYQYAHALPDRIADMQCLPDNLADRRYYLPTEEGNEARAKQRLDAVLKWREEHHTKQ